MLSVQLKAQRYNFIRYSVEEGLPRSGVYHILEDKKGFIWVSTEGGGAARFDGVDWQYYSTENILLSNIVRVTFEDNKGKIWFGTEDGGATYFDGKTVKHFFTSDSLKVPIRSIAQTPDGNIWFGTLGKGIYILNPETEKVIILSKREGLPDNNVRVLFNDNQNSLWIGTDKGLCRYDYKTLEIIYFEHPEGNNQILSLFEDIDQNLWIGSPAGVSKFDGRNIETFTTKDGLLNNRVRAINQDLQGNLWFGTFKGLSKYDGKTFKNFTKKNGLSNNRIRSIMTDFTGNLWIGTYFGGVNKFNGELFQAYTEQEGLSNDQIADVKNIHSEVWLATLDGINILKNIDCENLEISVLTTENGLPSNEIKKIFHDNRDRIWIATSNGLAILDKKNKVSAILNKESGLANNKITAIFQQNDTIFWVGTNDGLSRIKTSSKNTLNILKIQNYPPSVGLAGKIVSGIEKDIYNRTWVTFKDGSVTVFEKLYFYNPFFSKYLNKITAITKDSRENIWIGTEGNGFFKINPEKIEYGTLAARHYTKSDGIYSNKVYSLIFDNSENLLIGYKSGIERIILDSNDDVISSKHFGAEDGFTGIEANENAIEYSKGGVWFGSIKGAICYNPIHDITNTMPPKVYIKDLRLFFEKTDWVKSGWADETEGWFHLPKNLILPYDKNHISIDFVGLAFTRPKRIHYQWKMEGIDNNWSPLSSKKEMTYADLPPGEYTFKVRAANEDNFWSEPATVSFTIETPFWKSITFYILAIFALILFIALLLRIRILQERKQKQELEEQVVIRTYELEQEKATVEKQNKAILEQSKQLEDQHEKLTELYNVLRLRDQDVTDSLNYAQRIQLALLYYEQNQLLLFDKMFVLYEPKDIVSGDFYWQFQYENFKYMLVADCTGHGVPGAFMSIIGHTLVQKILLQYPNALPSEILSYLDIEITNSLHQHNDKNRDGMDLSICRVDSSNNQVVYSGAMRPFVAIKRNKPTPELIYIKGDRFGVGGEEYNGIEKVFTNHNLQLEKNDRMFMFSDGYVDQFGGNAGKKFMIKRFRELLLKLSTIDIDDHEYKLYEVFNEWKGKYEQVDDILIVGIEL